MYQNNGAAEAKDESSYNWENPEIRSYEGDTKATLIQMTSRRLIIRWVSRIVMRKT
jgi:hypothetical protein